MLTKRHAKPCTDYNTKRDGCRVETKLGITLRVKRTILTFRSELNLDNRSTAEGDVSKVIEERFAPFLRLLN